MLPIHFIVQGTPKSAQGRGRSRKRWMQAVRNAAAQCVPSGASPSIEVLRARVHFFFTATALDVDNILKPILDAMNALVYVDDSQIIDIIATKRSLSTTIALRGAAPLLVGHLAANGGRDFVYVVVEQADEVQIP